MKFFSVDLFREVVNRLDGIEYVKYDIFVHISGDGDNPFQ